MDFSKIWGSNGNVSAPTDAQYLQGFDFLGSAPPTVELFNYLFQFIDLKLKELKDSDATLFWQPAIDYEVGDVRFPATGAYKYLECTVAGTSGSAEPAWPAPGGTVTDGGVTWIVRDLRVATAQFDNSEKLATTSFVKKSGFSFGGADVIDASTTLTATSAGRLLLCNALTPITIQLPLSDSLPVGTTLTFMSTSTGPVTVSRQGTNQIAASSSSLSQVVLNNGDTLTLQTRGGSLWYAIGGSAQLQYSTVFNSSLTASGYQKLPSGLIIQWGTVLSTSAGSVTLPIAFPSEYRVFIQADALSGTFNTGVNRTSSAAFVYWLNSAVNMHWFAIGY